LSARLIDGSAESCCPSSTPRIENRAESPVLNREFPT